MAIRIWRAAISRRASFEYLLNAPEKLIAALIEGFEPMIQELIVCGIIRRGHDWISVEGDVYFFDIRQTPREGGTDALILHLSLKRDVARK